MLLAVIDQSQWSMTGVYSDRGRWFEQIFFPQQWLQYQTKIISSPLLFCKQWYVLYALLCSFKIYKPPFSHTKTDQMIIWFTPIPPISLDEDAGDVAATTAHNSLEEKHFSSVILSVIVWYNILRVHIDGMPALIKIRLGLKTNPNHKLPNCIRQICGTRPGKIQTLMIIHVVVILFI